MLTICKKSSTLATLVAFIFSMTAHAQNPIRPFSQVFSENLKGGVTMFGNTILESGGNTNNIMNQASNPNNGAGGQGYSSYGNDGREMKEVDIDNLSSTQNSSSADLILPAGTNRVKFARLYWGGKINTSIVTSNPDTLRKVKIRKGNAGAYFNAVTPTVNVDQYSFSPIEKSYQSFVDITSFVNSNGGGTYTVADIPVSPGSSSNGGKFGGWCIVVAYENLTQPYNSIRLYDGFAQVYDNGNISYLTINLTGLNVPSTPLLANEAVMGTMAWEGDANLGATSANPAGDFIKLNNVTASNAANPAANFWNGSITNNGAYVTSKNPNYSNQMGIDIDEINVGTGYNIAPNATSVTVQFGTEADMYFPSIFTFSIRVKDPTVVLDKFVTDANNNGFVESLEELTYTLSGTNQGAGSSYNTYVVDSLPNNVTYVANSLEIVRSPGLTPGFRTDAADNDQAFFATYGSRNYVKFFIGTGANGSSGGELPVGPSSSYSVKFKVRSLSIPGSIINTARIFGNSVVGDLFTDDGTAVIGESGAPTPVKMTSFTATLLNRNQALLNWATASEIDNDYFEIQRSFDGVRFESRGKVNGNGTTNASNNYQYNDVTNAAPVVYYRLKIVDFDGKYTFSKVIALKTNGNLSVEKFGVYPNPFVSNIKISLNSLTDNNATVRVLSFDGKEILRRSVSIQKGDNIVVLNDFGTISSGNYILEVSTATDKFIKKIIKN